MPTYDYVCRACAHRFEHFQSMQEPTLRKCPECGRLKLERLIGSGAGILFKGSGFYETDYKRKSPPAAGADGASPSEGAPRTEGTSKGEPGAGKAGGTKDGGTKSGGTRSGAAKGSPEAGGSKEGGQAPGASGAGPAAGSPASPASPPKGRRSKDA